MRYLAALVVLALVAGCAQIDRGGSGADDALREQSPRAEASESPALGLVGLWRLSGVEGEAAETWVRIDGRELMIIGPCGQTSADWRATETRFIASAYSRSGACGVGEGLGSGGLRVDWLESVTDYRAVPGGWELAGGDGETVAVLAVDGMPLASPDLWDGYRAAPEVTEDVRAKLRLAATLAADLVAAKEDDLLGRWVPRDYRGALDPHVEFEDDSWSGSDGCNGGMGRWIVDEGGALLATAGASTLIGCDGWQVPSLVSTAGRAAIDGDELVLFDPDGVETGRLVRD